MTKKITEAFLLGMLVGAIIVCIFVLVSEWGARNMGC